MERDSQYFVYILECADGTYYTGITNSLQRRIKQHNDGVASKYTRVRRPVRYVYIESVPDKSTALKREHQIKKLSRKRKVELVKKKGAEGDVGPEKL